MWLETKKKSFHETYVCTFELEKNLFSLSQLKQKILIKTKLRAMFFINKENILSAMKPKTGQKGQT